MTADPSWLIRLMSIYISKPCVLLLFILILIYKNIKTLFLGQRNVTGHLICIYIFFIHVMYVENKYIGKTRQHKDESKAKY